MQIFLFDLLPFDRHFDEFKAGRHMPFPLPGSYFDPEVAARSYEQHLAVWEEMDRLGYDGVGLNEHHTTPHGLMNSPNMMAVAGAQRTKRLKFFILGNLSAAAQSAAHRRGACDGGLHFARPHHGGLRARGAARIQGL